MAPILRAVLAAALLPQMLAACCSLSQFEAGSTAAHSDRLKVAAPSRSEGAADPKSAGAAASKSQVAAAPESEDDAKRRWCGQRHIDYQDGKSPGGAKSLEQKRADDRVCEDLQRQN